MTRLLTTLLALSLPIVLSGAASAPAWTISLKSIGPVELGSTISEFRRAMGRDLAPGEISSDCGYASSRDGEVSFYTRNGRVAIAKVYEGRPRTRSGIGIGTPVEDLIAAYPDRLVAGLGGEAEALLVYTPRDRSDRGFRINFSVDDGAVSSIEIGTTPDILSTGEASRCFSG